jgi:hypothetical protein
MSDKLREETHKARCRLERCLSDRWARAPEEDREKFKLQEELGAARHFVNVGTKRLKAICEHRWSANFLGEYDCSFCGESVEDRPSGIVYVLGTPYDENGPIDEKRTS